MLRSIALSKNASLGLSYLRHSSNMPIPIKVMTRDVATRSRLARCLGCMHASYLDLDRYKRQRLSSLLLHLISPHSISTSKKKSQLFTLNNPPSRFLPFNPDIFYLLTIISPSFKTLRPNGFRTNNHNTLDKPIPSIPRKPPRFRSRSRSP
jgi:hypothetical protein